MLYKNVEGFLPAVFHFELKKKSPCLKLIDALEHGGLFFFYLIYPRISVKHVQTSCGTPYKSFHDVHRRKQRHFTHRLCCPYQDNLVTAATVSHQYKVYIFRRTIYVASQHLTIKVSQWPFQLVFLLICKQSSPYSQELANKKKKSVYQKMIESK